MAEVRQDASIQANDLREYQIVLDLVKRQYASVVWTHRVHEKQAEIYASRYAKLETANVVSAAATTCCATGTILANSLVADVLTVVCSFVTLAITAYYKSFDIKGQAVASKTAANQFVVARNNLLYIIADLYRHQRPLDSIEDDVRGVMQDLGKLYIDAPPTSQRAVDMATVAMGSGNTYVMTDEQIDELLPHSLRGPIAKVRATDE